MTQANSKNLMTEGVIWKKILFFALPIFFGNLFQQLYNTADSLIVGNFLGSEALAAVSSSGNLSARRFLQRHRCWSWGGDRPLLWSAQ